MTNTPLSRRTTLAAFAGAAMFPIAGKAVEASPAASPWPSLRIELTAAYDALTAACEAFDETSDAAGPISPLGRPVLVPSPNNNLPGCAWDWRTCVRKQLSNAAQVNAFYDDIAHRARASALEHEWFPGDLDQFLAEGERYRANALATLYESSQERHEAHAAMMDSAVRMCGEAAERESAIEKLVRSAPANSLEAVEVKLLMLRHKIDEEEYGFAAKHLDEMLSDLAAITGLRPGRAA